MSLTATETRASESNHWYTKDGVPMYTVEGLNGKQRNTTLRDAKKMNLVPSVTTILGIVAKPGLDQWKQKQAILAALTLPKLPNESEDDYIKRIITDSKEQGRMAADRGTEIHAAIQSFYEDKHHGLHEFVMACDTEIYRTYGDQKWICERAFAHEMGFGGKVDMHADNIVIDIKTKDFTDAKEVAPYDEHMMQLAAYRVGLGMPNAACANVFVSRNVPGLVAMHIWDEKDLQRGWKMFVCLLEYYQHKSGLK